MPNASATIQRSGKPEQGPFYVLDGQLLAAAGAVFKPAYVSIPPEARRMNLIATYVAGAGGVNGSVKMRLLWKVAAGTPEAAASDVYEAIIDGTTVAKSGAFLSNPMYVYELIGPPISDPGSLNFRFLSCEVPIDAVAVTVEVFEVGDTAHPGILTLRAYTSDRV